MGGGSDLWIDGTVRYAFGSTHFLNPVERRESRWYCFAGRCRGSAQDPTAGFGMDTISSKVGIRSEFNYRSPGRMGAYLRNSRTLYDFDSAIFVSSSPSLDNVRSPSRSVLDGSTSSAPCASNPATEPLLRCLCERFLSNFANLRKCKWKIACCLPRIMSNPRPAAPPRTGSTAGVSQPLSRGTTLGSASSDVERKKRSRNLLRDYYGLAGKAGDPLDIGESLCAVPALFLRCSG